MIKIVSGVLHEDIDLWRWCHRLLLDPCAVCGGERCDSAGPWDLAGNLGAGRADHRSPSAKKTTHDRPRIIGALNGEHYDLVFAVMQYQQMAAILDDLTQADSPVVVLVGNNMDAGKMETYIQAHTAAHKNGAVRLSGHRGTAGDG